MCIFHKWGKWEEYATNIPSHRISENFITVAATDFRQKKKCERCGYVKDESIRQISSKN